MVEKDTPEDYITQPLDPAELEKLNESLTPDPAATNPDLDQVLLSPEQQAIVDLNKDKSEAV